MADDVLVFKVAARQQRPTVKVQVENPDGSADVYDFTPPKDTLGMLSVIDPTNYPDRTPLEDNFGWLYAGLPDEQATRLRARLTDPEDPLDYQQFDSLFAQLIERVNGRPPTSPGA